MDGMEIQNPEMVMQQQDSDMELVKEEVITSPCDERQQWFFAAIYASPHENTRRNLWGTLRSLVDNIRGEWLLAGDFNEIACPSEKKRGGRVDSGNCRRFSEWIDNCSLIDLGYIGTRFTWRGPKWEGLDRIFKRLDRALSDVNWRTRFPEARIDVPTRTKSDYHPLWTVMRDQIEWMIEDGRDVKFWLDNWVKSEGRLIDVASNTIPEDLVEASVRDFIDERGEWNIQVLQQFLPTTTIEKIRSMPTPKENIDRDNIA
ncbi:hypothetical protein Ahy_B10g101061 [Arachis hypogaea]|uniref:Endonuclease/exonuclease/phosphatase domain-containing protein n=1 Tax=Arachis hypogaea TaxID=3818 RepID=A0A444WYD9_ARAHY|nr:hypothetical protein Ahy_B10g101061 [Arachis hypogaea]